MFLPSRLRIFGFILLFATGLLTSCQDKGHLPDKAEYNEIVPALQRTTRYWNRGDLDGFISLYDTAATFMLKTGPVGVAKMKQHYQDAYFAPGKKRQQLAFQDLQVRPLGPDLALLTGQYILSGNQEPEHRGRYSLIFQFTGQGWKIIHDHSS